MFQNIAHSVRKKSGFMGISLFKYSYYNKLMALDFVANTKTLNMNVSELMLFHIEI